MGKEFMQENACSREQVTRALEGVAVRRRRCRSLVSLSQIGVRAGSLRLACLRDRWFDPPTHPCREIVRCPVGGAGPDASAHVGLSVV